MGWLDDLSIISGRSVLPELNELAYRPTVLPMARTVGGGLAAAWPAMVSDPARNIAAFMDDPSAATVAPLGLDLAGGGMAASMAVKGAPAGAVGMFAGKGAKTADRAALMRAEEMAASGADRNDIWRETGWFKGVDGKWRWEIDDAPMQTRRSYWDAYDRGEVVGDNPNLFEAGSLRRTVAHPDLFEAYPGLRDVPSDLADPYLTGSGVRGSYSPEQGVRVSPEWKTGADARSVTLHELQHAVQEREGFARGGDTWNVIEEDLDKINKQLGDLARLIEKKKKQLGISGYRQPHAELKPLYDRYDDLMGQRHMLVEPGEGFRRYQRLAGETEARNVQERRAMTAAERRAIPPWETQDVADEAQIVRFDAKANPFGVGAVARDVANAARGLGLGGEGPLYHATTQQFDRFRPRSYFARDRAYAEDWVQGSEKYGGHIKEVYISPKKRYRADEYETSIIASDPALLDAAEASDRAAILSRLEREGYDVVDLPVGGRFGDEVLVLDPDIIEMDAKANPFGASPLFGGRRELSEWMAQRPAGEVM